MIRVVAYYYNNIIIAYDYKSEISNKILISQIFQSCCILFFILFLNNQGKIFSILSSSGTIFLENCVRNILLKNEIKFEGRLKQFVK